MHLFIINLWDNRRGKISETTTHMNYLINNGYVLFTVTGTEVVRKKLFGHYTVRGEGDSVG